MDISLIWFMIIGVGVLIYVILDGFDLGLGILFPFVKNKAQRDVMMNTVAPVWDGNETWMILGGAGLFGAFPMVYATVLSALYLPMVLMVVALIFRGVAFEFRAKEERHRPYWDIAFIAGSTLTAFLQGVILGALIQGIRVQNGVFSGSVWDWLTPFTLLTGVGVVVMYAVLGATWLLVKTDDHLQQQMYDLLPKLLMALAAILVMVGISTPMLAEHYRQRWFGGANGAIFALMALAVLLMVWRIQAACRQKRENQPFVYTLFLVMTLFVGLVLSVFPYVMPLSLDIWQAAAPRASQQFALIGALIFIPIILVYTALNYWVFRDKVRVGDEGYH